MRAFLFVLFFRADRFSWHEHQPVMRMRQPIRQGPTAALSAVDNQGVPLHTERAPLVGSSHSFVQVECAPRRHIPLELQSH